jgi:hypothetical protein
MRDTFCLLALLAWPAPEVFTNGYVTMAPTNGESRPRIMRMTKSSTTTVVMPGETRRRKFQCYVRRPSHEGDPEEEDYATSSSSNDDNDGGRTDFLSTNNNNNNHHSLPRRALFRNSFLSWMAATTSLALDPPLPAKAELVQFPCAPGTLRNTYHFMRAGQSLLEAQNVWGTNPLFLTNRENALSNVGIHQVQEACRVLDDAQLHLSLVKFPLTANAIDTSDIIASTLQIGRNQMVPEYTYMDQRGIGKWDMLPLDSTLEAVWAMDAKEADKDGWVRFCLVCLYVCVCACVI